MGFIPADIVWTSKAAGVTAALRWDRVRTDVLRLDPGLALA
jgi:hypothetical protein